MQTTPPPWPARHANPAGSRDRPAQAPSSRPASCSPLRGGDGSGLPALRSAHRLHPSPVTLEPLRGSSRCAGNARPPRQSRSRPDVGGASPRALLNPSRLSVLPRRSPPSLFCPVFVLSSALKASKSPRPLGETRQ